MAPSTSAAQLLANPDTRNVSVFRRALERHPRHRNRRAVPASAYAVNKFGPHVQTGIDKVHASGQIGAGIKVRNCPLVQSLVAFIDVSAPQIGILDEGIDYNNPILGGCFGEGCQISFGYDFVGNGYDGVNTPIRGPDPCELDVQLLVDTTDATPSPSLGLL